MDAPEFSVKFIDHLVLRTGDVERLSGFYSDVIGLKIERQTESGMTQLRAGMCLLDIVPVDDRDLPGRNLERFCFRVDPFDLEAIRGRLGLSQSAFAASFGFSLASVQSWERTKNRRKPDRAARAYLMVISRQPVAVHKALRDRDAQFVLAGASPSITRVVAVMKLDRVFDVYPDIDAAVIAMS